MQNTQSQDQKLNGKIYVETLRNLEGAIEFLSLRRKDTKNGKKKKKDFVVVSFQIEFLTSYRVTESDYSVLTV
jgi:hypothetical protein